MQGRYRAASRVRASVASIGAAVLTAALIGAAWASPGQKKKHAPKPARAAAAPANGAFSLYPPTATIDGSYGLQTLAATLTAPDGSVLEVTGQASFTSSNSTVVRVQNGVAIPVGDGNAEITASFGGRSARTKITVRNCRTDADLSFANDITPILIKHGCIGSACHGAANGQGGFKLSFFGYEPDKDREAIWVKDNGRRVNAQDPANSMLVLKTDGVIPHAGGKKIAKGGPEYRTFVAWIRAGGPVNPKSAVAAAPAGGAKLASLESRPARAEAAAAPQLESIEVWPAERTVRQAGSQHQLIVMGKYSDGTERDVTPMARYFSDDDGVAAVNSTGRITATRHGEANVMVRYNGKATVANFLSLTRPQPASFPAEPVNNFIDTHVFAKLKRMGIVPSELSSDAEFCRRVHLDIAGVLPTANAVRNFVASTDPQKRSKLIDELLERPEYQDVMTIQWCDLLRVNRTFLQVEGVRAYTAFIRDAFADNMPFDQFVREIIGSGTYPREAVDRSRDSQSRADTAIYHKSSGHYYGPVNYYRVTADPQDLTTSTSQIFLGVRLDCCRCHNHPFDRWTQQDFYQFAAYFAGTGHTPGKVRDELAVYTDKNGRIANPRTNQVCDPKPLGEGKAEPDTVGDRHMKLATWMTSPENPFFARATVNRFWKHFFGRGIVHPADDFRATNPPVNPPLLEALAKDFVEHKFDIKHLIRTICNSRTYQLDSKTNASNESDSKNFSHYYSKRLGPEVLFDAITTATGVGETFGLGAQARRATNLPDNSVGNYFLDVFGRSRRLQVQERSDQTSMSQALQLMNGDTIHRRITDPNGTVARILKAQFRAPEAVDEIYLSTLNRPPTDSERTLALKYIDQSGSPKEGYEDLMWAILNSREFIFNH